MPKASRSDRPIALVTGATGGMGREIARDLARDHHVIALGRCEAELDALGQIDGIFPMAVDLADFDDVERILGDLPRLDILVHSAAIAERHTTASASVDDWRRHLELNVIVPAEITRMALPALRASEGQLIFINSGAGGRSIGGHAVYSASKFALRALADAVRQEESAHRVRVATVAPGPTDTGMLRADLERSGVRYEPVRYIDPVSVARAVRAVVAATPDAQITEVAVRPRVELQ